MFDRKTLTLAITSLAAALVALAVGPRAGAATAQITTCGQVAKTNAVLTQDLDCPGEGIAAGAAGITIDLGGHVLKGSNNGFNGIADLGGWDHVTVKNGVVRNFSAGVYAWIDSDNVTVSDIVAVGNAKQGIYIDGASATIKSSTASENGTSGIEIVGNSAAITSSMAVRNGDQGIWVKGDGGSVKSSRVVGNVSTGAALEGDHSSVTSSVLSGNSWNGLRIEGDSASVKSTTASANTNNGIEVEGESAIIKANHVEGNGMPNGASDGQGLGIAVSSLTNAPVGTNVVRGNDDPAECKPSSLCPVIAKTKPGLQISSCGQSVTTNAVLTQSLTCLGTHGIVVGASGITIDLNGHVLKGDGAPNRYGIDDSAGYDDVTIENGVVRNFGAGVNAASGADHVTISKLVAAGNNTGINVDGIYSSITSSTASGNGGTGISLAGDRPSITSSSAAGNVGNGMYLNSDVPSITSSSALGNAGNGILLKSGPATVASSNLSGNQLFGIEVDNNESVSIRSTTASGNGSGGLFLSGNALMLKGNRAEGNGFSGGASDGLGVGIFVSGSLTGPVSPNVVRGNDDPSECKPMFC